MDDIAELLAAYREVCAKASVAPLPEDEIEEWPRAILANGIIVGATVH